MTASVRRQVKLVLRAVLLSGSAACVSVTAGAPWRLALGASLLSGLAGLVGVGEMNDRKPEA